MEDSVASVAGLGDDIKPYKIHVSSKYLELTKKKLELTRLPHELLLPQSREWELGTPKSEIEPLIDFWLEQYSWRTQESHLNSILPQFRTAIAIDSSPTPFRMHFTHIKSLNTNAIPLLLLPTFPLTNLSLEPLLKQLTDPNNAQDEQAYHVVAPSIPGLGFSDAFTAVHGPETSILEDTAQIFNLLMLRLGYTYYIASSTGSGITSPANVDYQIPRTLATKHSGNCVGIHVIDPPVQSPTFSSSPISWTKFAIAKFFHAPIFGYTSADWGAMRENHLRSIEVPDRNRVPRDIEANTAANTPLVSRPVPCRHGSSYGSVGLLGLREPNTLAYALCDSPVGLLSLVLNGLRRLSPGHSLSRTEIINITQLAWLPGPEGAMRFWSGAEAELGMKMKWSATPTSVTVFLGSGEDGVNTQYVCPSWAETSHNIVYTKRQEGKAGLLALERTDAIIEGIRGLTREVLKTDTRLAAGSLEEVVAVDAIVEEEEMEVRTVMQDDMPIDAESPDTVILSPTA